MFSFLILKMLLNVELCQFNHKNVSNIPQMACPKLTKVSVKKVFQVLPSYLEDLVTCMKALEKIQSVSRRHPDNPGELAYKLGEEKL